MCGHGAHFLRVKNMRVAPSMLLGIDESRVWPITSPVHPEGAVYVTARLHSNLGATGQSPAVPLFLRGQRPPQITVGSPSRPCPLKLSSSCRSRRVVRHESHCCGCVGCY